MDTATESNKANTIAYLLNIVSFKVRTDHTLVRNNEAIDIIRMIKII